MIFTLLSPLLSVFGFSFLFEDTYMASDESISRFSSMQEDDYDDSDDAHGCDHQSHPLNLSRLSMCTSSMYTNEEEEDDDDDDDDDDMRMFMSRLSIESFDGDDADEEFSDEKEGKAAVLDLSSDSDKEPGCYSLPATPHRRRNRGGGLANNNHLIGFKDYASENEAQKVLMTQTNKRSLRKRRVIRERSWLESGVDGKLINKKDEENIFVVGCGNSFSGGESEGGGCGSGGGGVVMITRPKGGKRPLCMDMEEVKACKDLGFELEHERMLDLPSRVSLSGSTLDTSSGGNSPIANWRISSPGDDPRDVKARLKVWAQAVALASAARHSLSVDNL
ncbi:hypothetical protein CFOL_v3_27983 [Cephalotus follicularis]|uniref:Uncharacterized protein n=1 Tax=Cephalotus follicularis TaxID=3775 RepID=A0A1Q3CWC8_CEPFO|nr:hypothetical protein CFOL_v3_27983 [Cephalotus follicularis]